jgi:hypothetical protein
LTAPAAACSRATSRRQASSSVGGLGATAADGGGGGGAGQRQAVVPGGAGRETRPPLVELGAHPLDLALHGLDLLALLQEEAADLAVLAVEVRARGAAPEPEGEGEGEGEGEAAGGGEPHWPRTTECARRLRAQQLSFSSWQSGSSFP